MVMITVSMYIEDRTVKRLNFLLAAIYSKGIYEKLQYKTEDTEN